MGKLAKLFGKTAVAGEAIADAFRIANGFLPVSEVYPWFPPDSILLAPALVLLSAMEPLDFAPAPYTGPSFSRPPVVLFC